MGNLNLDRKVSESSTFQPLPEGRYLLVCTQATEGPGASNPSNRRVACTIEVLDGKYKGRKIFENFNTVHEKDVVWKIGQQQLYRFALAVGLKRPAEDTSELVNIPFQADIGVREDESTGDLRNTIKSYYTQDGTNVNAIRKQLVGPGSSSQDEASAGPHTQGMTPPPSDGQKPAWLQGR